MRTVKHLSGIGTIALTAVGIMTFGACGSSSNRGDNGGGGGDDAGVLLDEAGNPIVGPADDGGLPAGETRDPVDCNEAKNTKSYVGCDYWPTVTANNVWSIFDFVAVVANTGTQAADVTVTGGTGVNLTATVPPGALKKIYLPWVPALKGADADECGSAKPMTASVKQAKGAYHLVSSTPVIVYQFNALEYKGEGGESPTGGAKDWSTCPGSALTCRAPLQPPRKVGCYSFSNDASLLLPSTAMTGNYRLTGLHGWTESSPLAGSVDIMGPHFAVTGTQNGTNVTVRTSPSSKVLAGGGLSATNGGGTLTFSLDAGDVVEVVGAAGSATDFSGSLVQADKPVQVLTGIPCIYMPQGKQACDHVEESVLPAETLGKHYVVTVPTGPQGNPVGHDVRLFGNVDGTTLTYTGPKPNGCPSSLSAGQVVDCGVVSADFEVSGDHEFGVASIQLGSQLVDPPASLTSRGDPSQTHTTAVEQYRTKYLFLAPDDYDVSYVDITGTSDAGPVLDGQPIGPNAFKPINGSTFGVFRVKLAAGQSGAHTLTATKSVGVQVMGYGAATSYGYPGGLNLKLIAPPPPPPR